METAWVETLNKAQKTCMIQDGRRKIHFTLLDGRELAEEYDLRTDELVVRKWRKTGVLGGAGKWEFEVGEQLAPHSLDAEGFMESSSNPIFIRKDTKTAFQWRIRNLPYPVEIYNVTCDEDQNVIIRTTNKKYYKTFHIPDLERCNIPLEQTNITIAHANNTLIVSYKKPAAILAMEQRLRKEFSAMKASRDGDVDCTPS